MATQEELPGIDSRGVSAAFLKRFLNGLKAQQGASKFAELTTRDARDLVVLPRTKARQCAYVELVADESPSDVGPANIFVSHAWRYKIADVLGALIQYAEDRPDEQFFFWFDLFFNNQNILANLPQEWWSTTFKDSIAAIGHVVLVLTPWSDPIPLTRAWCLWEIFCSLSQEDVQLTILLPHEERKALVATILEDSDAVTDTMVRVQAEKAEAWSAADKEMIFKAIEDNVGFQTLNEKVKDQMRAWCLDTLVQHIDDAYAQLESRPWIGAATSTAAEPPVIRGQTAKEEADTFAALCFQAGTTLQKFGRADDAIRLLTMAFKLETATGHPNAAGSLHQLAMVYGDTGEYQTAVSMYTCSLKMKEQQFGPDSEHLASSHNNLGDLYRRLGDHDQAIMHNTRAVEIMKAARGEQHESLAQPLFNLGIVHQFVGNYTLARKNFEETVGVMLETRGEHHPLTAFSYDGLGCSLRRLGEYEASRTAHEKAISVLLVTLGREHKRTAEAYTNLGNVCQAMGDKEAAMQHMATAVEISSSVLGRDNTTTGVCVVNLAGAHEALGEADKAAELYREALAVFEKHLGPRHEHTASVHRNLGDLYAQARENDKALQHYNTALDIALGSVGEEHPTTALTLYNMGSLHDVMGQKRQAVGMMERALAGMMASAGPNHPHTQHIQAKLAEAREGLEQQQEQQQESEGEGEGSGDGGRACGEGDKGEESVGDDGDNADANADDDDDGSVEEVARALGQYALIL
ncbi:hypothetical protein PTSG_08085 [Salpingoeca rosetta]|uniref:Uncharacterized protein n=1 Tax=Salpingoeca rosetta (strain ATCC 50818 / BSB-021) TaxID=946362 RepID=F2UHY5_SALR5|nr:uncharacterized protein PTSG_08085 [Salpingoeca rosetta]EGD76734.1 hypothetical protein PTSG_08085 [Salpingoeca rosetta]|eukprot:XP_004991106.1 hypothetical protein PTSG_08085 [Salpingoeca rosetta]